MRYRDKTEIMTEIIIKLQEYGSMNKTKLISFCGMNQGKHQYILDELENIGLIKSSPLREDAKTTITYVITQYGIESYSKIIYPYVNLFKNTAEIKPDSE